MTEGKHTTPQKSPVELEEDRLDTTAGGRKAGEQPKEYLKIKLDQVLVSGSDPS